MPNTAKYLSPNEITTMINLRGKEQPSKIAKMFGIGLTRLYKIWTDSSPDKKFPGGFAGTEAGKYLTDKIKALSDEIAIQENKAIELKKTLRQLH